METKIIGIDPSMTATGLALPSGSTETIVGKSSEGDRRLLKIRKRLLGAIEAYGPDDLLAVVEDLPTHAQGAGISGMVQGTIRVTLIEAGVPYITVTPASLKTFATGKGNAPKPELRMSLFRRMGIDLSDDNQCDAWWLRAIGHHLTDQPLLTLPQSHLRALDKVTRPPRKG